MAMCACNEGYEMIGEGERCEDIDECADGVNGGCDQLCVNKPGGFMCDCRKGYTAQGSFCSDENECLLNNGHGPCQDTCTNTNGGYLCSCEGLAGTQLDAKDNHTCAERKGCSVDNGGCTHQCIDSYNQVFCLCPEGYKLQDDWKTCRPDNACLEGNGGCEQICIHHPATAARGAGHECDCRAGFRMDSKVENQNK